MKTITIIGITDQQPPCLDSHVEELVSHGKTFSGGRRHHELVAHLLPKEARWIDITTPLAEVFAQYREIDDDIVAFASGDPLFYGFAVTLQREFPDATMTVVPTFNSLQMLAHRITLPYHDMTVVSLTGRPWNAFDAALIQGKTKIGCLTDNIHTPAAIAQRMIDYGYTHYYIYIGERLGNPNEERITRCTLEEAANKTFTTPNCVIITSPSSLPTPPSPIFGLPDEDFAVLDGRPGMMTKMPIRLLSLQAMNLGLSHVMWDIGFCTGSVSIEAKRMFPMLDIVAFERREEGRKLMAENTRRFGTPGITAIIGDFFRQDLTALPRPDSVFIGGHGGRLVEMIARIKPLLNTGGCIVMNCVTKDSSEKFRGTCQMLGLKLMPTTRIQLNDYNPIEIMKCVKQ
ncbi:MAG: precorrin-6y C5,15-methyltransferase (decarboxylating) subunit CbiE [Prevotella sp.]